MNKSIFVVIGGIVVGLIAAGAFLVVRTSTVSANPDFTPQNVSVERVSPTAAEIRFVTLKNAVAGLNCSTSASGPFNLCASETQPATSHTLKTSVILDPDSMYYFTISVNDKEYLNGSIPYEIPEYVSSKTEFPTSLIGICSDDEQFNEEFDINKDGCIRANDRVLYMTQ